jgi:hypothetical protein
VTSRTGSREPDPGSRLEDEGVPDLSDALPAKVITGDGQEEPTPPGEAPSASVDFGTTAEEARSGEPLAGRLAREEPDATRLRGDGDDNPYPEDREEEVGRLVELREDGTGKQQDAWAQSVGADRGGFAPEERAMHDEP